MTRRYCFIRHAQAQTGPVTHDFALFRADMLARLDPPLTIAGIDQARRLGLVLQQQGVQAIIPSPMIRSRQTACHAAEAGGIALSPCLETLREVAVGTAFEHFDPWVARLSGAPLGPVLQRGIGDGLYNLASLWCLVRWLQGRTRDGEALDQVNRRIAATLAHLDNLPQSRIAVIGHAFWLFCLARRLAPPLVRRIGWFHHVCLTSVAADGRGHYQLMDLARQLRYD